MPNNRVKTVKALQSKKGKAALAKLHPHSRRAKQLTRVALRADKVTASKKDRRRVESSKVDRLLWFVNALDPSEPCCSLSGLHGLVSDYVSRNDETLEEERKARRPGRPKSIKQEKLEAEREREEIVYQSGIVVPDMTSAPAVVLLRQWALQHSGDPSFLPRIRLVRISKASPGEMVVEQEGAADKVSFNLPIAEDEGMDIGDEANEAEEGGA